MLAGDWPGVASVISSVRDGPAPIASCTISLREILNVSPVAFDTMYMNSWSDLEISMLRTGALSAAFEKYSRATVRKSFLWAKAILAPTDSRV